MSSRVLAEDCGQSYHYYAKNYAIVNKEFQGVFTKVAQQTGDDGAASLWDATSGVNLMTIPLDSAGAGSVAFSPGGDQLAVGAVSGVYVLILPVDEVVALAKSRLTRTLTLEECKK